MAALPKWGGLVRGHTCPTCDNSQCSLSADAGRDLSNMGCQQDHRTLVNDKYQASNR